MGVWPDGRRAASCEGNQERSTEDGGTAAGGCSGEEAWRVSLVRTEREKKQEKVSRLVSLEYVVHLGKLREVRLGLGELRQDEFQTASSTLLKGRNLLLETMRNHFKFLSKKDKMATARRRAWRGEGRAAGSLTGGLQLDPWHWQGACEGTERKKREKGRAIQTNPQSCHGPHPQSPWGDCQRQHLFGEHKPQVRHV